MRARSRAPRSTALAGLPQSGKAERLVKLAELRDQGVIAPEEFAARKAEILSRI